MITEGLCILLVLLVLLLALLIARGRAATVAVAVGGAAAAVGKKKKKRTGFPRAVAADCLEAKKIAPAASPCAATTGSGADDTFPFVARSAPSEGGLLPPADMFKNLKSVAPRVQHDVRTDARKHRGEPFRPAYAFEMVVQRTWPDDMRRADAVGLHFSDAVRARCRFGRKCSPAETWAAHREEIEQEARELRREHPRLSHDDSLREALYARAPWCNFFNPAFCLWVYRTLARRLGLKPGAVRIIDPSAGWGDRAIAACAFGARSYRGYDPNTAMRGAYERALDAFAPKDRRADFKVTIAPFAVGRGAKPNGHPTKPNGRGQPAEQAHIVLTSPPYFDLEDYPEEGGEAARRSGGSYPAWMRGFFEQYLRDAWDSVRPGGFLALYIENVLTADRKRVVPLADDTAAALKSMGAGDPVTMLGFQQLTEWDARGMHSRGQVRPMFVWQKGDAP